MDSTLLPMAESFRHTAVDVVSAILASAKERMVCKEKLLNTKMNGILVCSVYHIKFINKAKPLELRGRENVFQNVFAIHLHNI